MIGNKFGGLTVTSEKISVHDGKKSRIYRDCVCDCGTKTQVREDNLKNGNTQHCGCKLAVPSKVQKNLNKRINELEQQVKELKSLSLWSIRRLPSMYKDFAYDDFEKITAEKADRV